MKINKIQLLVTSIMMANMAFASAGSQIDLAGEWKVKLENESKEHVITLPGTTDDAGIGTPDTLTPMLKKPQLLHLTRKNRFVGSASYTRDINIPEAMAGKPLRINLERVMWKSCLEIDGNIIGECQKSLTTPHVYFLPEGLTAGNHVITLHIDNAKQYEISTNNLAHAYTDDTQIMWNGVLGSMAIEVIPEVDVRDIQVYPDVDSSQLLVKVSVDNSLPEQMDTNLKWDIKGFESKDSISGKRSVSIRPGINFLEFNIDDPLLVASRWSEFNPEVLTLSLQLEHFPEIKQIDFGMREVKAMDNSIRINGNPVFLRGTLECCVFPLTGTPPTDEKGWEKVFATAKEWGLNHLRFHSWCPPDAAFRVADRMGFYLQIECPLWSVDILPGEDGENGDMKHFIRSEYDAIVSNYGNHPSFCLMTVGNELQKDFDWLNDMTRHMHDTDPRRLYSATSFTFEKGHGGHPENYDDYLVTQWTDDGWVRGQGVFDQEPPSFNKNYSAAIGSLSVPLIEHEIGQYAVYPDLSEIEKYTGVLTPHNFVAVRNDLEKKGRLDRSQDYTRASGKLASILYKEELERALKTPGVSGIQMLGLQDFPGQGTALVGLLNAFWESKGIVDSSWFRQFCSPIVPLANFEKAVYEEGEVFDASIIIANYSDYSGSWNCRWRLKDCDELVAEGDFDGESLGKELNDIGDISIKLPSMGKARKLTFSVNVNNDSISNSWSLWVYPKDVPLEYGDVLVTKSLKEAKDGLKAGRKVLFTPPLDSIAGTRSKFVPVFWSPVHFPKEAGAMGVLCDPEHPALSLFPNDGHTDWQWWYPLKRSAYLDISDFKGLTPIIEMVDNFTTNRRLGLMFEAMVGEGSLLFSSIDLLSERDEDLASTQLLRSVLEYMKTDEFSPSGNLSETALDGLVTFPERKEDK
ncbi:MAG: glycoside hydrolase family 2 [Muribaculaceae bacterium]|nr:glycoside hydrolase family 2 [Muribaculaceae bacterium]